MGEVAGFSKLCDVFGAQLTSNQQTITYLRAVVHEILRIGLERMGLQSQDVNRILGHVRARAPQDGSPQHALSLARLPRTHR